ncbi:hypothetical protein J4455_04960 [Candidatus Woesearchaeota archaeon]|nr:hypothetical protein [Candidatus Woesearchaeota archaeon]
MNFRSKVEASFEKNYKKFIFIPLAILIISIILIFIQYQRTGDFLYKDISLKGGLSITINTNNDIDLNDLESKITSKFSSAEAIARKLTDFSTAQITGINIEASGVEEKDLKPFLEEYFALKLTNDNYSVEEVGASLGSSFFKDLIISLIFAFIFMAIVVFVIYRKFIPAITVILTALTDIIATLAVVNLLGIKISTAGIAAFLLLIGYSIDSDMLLTTKILRRKSSSAISEMYNAMKTGLMMTITTLVALALSLIFTNSIVIRQIFSIALIGLIIDIIATYLGNGPVLLWYAKKHETK